MLAVVLLVLGLSITSFLYGTYLSFSGFYQETRSHSALDTMILATASRTAKYSSEFLEALATSLQSSAESYNSNNPNGDTQAQLDRQAILQNYLQNLNLNSNSHLAQDYDFASRFWKIPSNTTTLKEYKLLHSDYLPLKQNPEDKIYNSTIIPSKTQTTSLTLNEFQAQIKAGNNIRISPILLATIVDNKTYNSILANPQYFGIVLSDSGLSWDSIPNGIEIKSSKALQS